MSYYFFVAAQIVHSGKSVLSLGYRGAHNKRHYYEDVALPENLVIIGDAVAHFNPCARSRASYSEAFDFSS